MTDLATGSLPLAGNQLIEASAGTGKTYTITNLYIRLLLGRGREKPLGVQQILVLTFTIAAAEELKHRIRKRIVEAKRVFSNTGDQTDEFLQSLKANSADAQRDLNLLTAASLLMDDASIFTIHGFCARVLDELSFETGVLFDQNLNADRDSLLQIAAEDCFRKHLIELPAFERQIAIGNWPNPEQLIQKTKPFLFREQLNLGPATRDISDEYNALRAKIAVIQQRWNTDNLTEIIKNAGFGQNRKVMTRLGLMNDLCQAKEPINLTAEIWEVYSQASLRSALKKNIKLPAHPVLDLIDEVWLSVTDVVNQININLWQLVTQSLKEQILQIKASTNELTLDDLLSQLSRALTTNPTLARQLSQRWPVAMIDEFQDTDDLQYGIFSRIHANSEHDCLLFIGDPKQAIYQFRGADIYTYLNARKNADDVHSLSVNWRSTASLISAINYLFGQSNVFGDGNIDYEENTPSVAADDMGVILKNQTPAPFHITLLQGEKRLTKPQARELSMAHAGEQIVDLLNQADDGAALVNGAPLNAGQIALLVRDKHDARAAQFALAERGIKSVYVTLESVFLQDTAEDLRLILEAVIDPTNDRAIKAAMATSLLNSSAAEIDAVNQDVVQHQQVLTEFQEYHHLWASLDVAPMIEALIVRRRIADKWLHLPNGDRQLTNLRHLGELLQQRSFIAPGMHQLLKWFTREKIAAETVAGEDRQLRLESDENLVKIVTMHAAKGLEYDVVMIPMAGFIAQQRSGEPALFHEKHHDIYTTHLDFCPDEQLQETAQQEKYEEDMRLLYVAITRARYLCYLGIPDTKNLTNSAVSKLLGLQDRENRHLDYLSNRLPSDLFHVTRVTSSSLSKREDIFDASLLHAPPPAPSPHDQWRVHSYTGVSRRLKKLIEHGETFNVAGYGDDDNDSQQPEVDIAFNSFTFPRGPRVGIALHSLFEDIAFDANETEISERCHHYLTRMGMQEDPWQNVLSTWIKDVLTTPLDPQFCLADIPDRERINELEFHFPVTMTEKFIRYLKSNEYLQTITGDQSIQFEGMMTGLIDLIVRINNKYYLIDYKSNYLGNSYDNYTPEALQFAVQEHNYDLQYLIYCVALHRYLDARLPDYSYESHFGGVKYLFLRGMQGENSTDTGIYTDRPSLDLMLGLDALLKEPADGS
ncbi:MAG: exodeoxyribonuclease V subunit beta [Pseudomonadales bacterium]|nr:exodeoxyribonuclease V subunit beta [Pseudomonadales bacterium]